MYNLCGMKISRPQYGLEEEIVEAIYALRDKKSSDIFKEPVDAAKIPDYYIEIKNPIDLTTIQKKLKEGKYRYSQEIQKDLDLIVENCKTYNTYNPNIIKKAEQFQQCIKTVWGNFRREIEKKGIYYSKPIEINQEILKRIGYIEEKKNRRKNPTLHMTIEQEKKNILPTVSVLPPLEVDLQKNEKDDLSQELQYRAGKYLSIERSQRDKLINIKIEEENLKTQFEQLSLKKLIKYRKILKKRLKWFDEKIVQKCLQKKRFKKMLVPNHLSMFVDDGSIAQQLNIRKLQLYIKQITYWVEDNSNILNDYMKDRFVENCKLTKKCILRVIKYKKIPRLRSLLDNSLYGTQVMFEQGENDRQDENYDNRMKEFKRNLDRDRAESTKRDTKIILRNQNGQLQVIDWTSDKKQERIRKEGGGTTRVQMPDTDEKRKQEERKKQEMRRDEEFIEEYSKKSNVLLVGKYSSSLRINWDIVSFPDIELPKQFNFNYSYTDDDL